MPHIGASFRIGISGAPGVGKSTFIEAFGSYLLEQGRRVAVLTIDPSSPITGGSILGDKTRMENLARQENSIYTTVRCGRGPWRRQQVHPRCSCCCARRPVSI